MHLIKFAKKHYTRMRNNVEYPKNLERKSEYYSYIKFIDDFIDKNKSFNQDIKIDECLNRFI